ncbi:methyl-accepting chemotaxis protein [Vibrio sp. HN007]|uniref:methyl-accepting chemotaxis protein n=1 Tax=Vibrio iocasae TaxID=3098914 RepID=UPI0035D3E34E
MNYHSVKFRLRAMSAFVIIALLAIAYTSISSMQTTAKAIEVLYSQGMANSNRASKAINLVGNARGELLLAFQHDPDGKFATMHDHPVNLHLDRVLKFLGETEDLLKNEILVSDLTDEQRNLANSFVEELRKITDLGFNVSVSEMRKGNFTNANQILLTVINPRFVNVDKIATEFLESQVNDARNTFIETEDYISSFTISLSVAIPIVACIIIFLALIILGRIRKALEQIQSTAEKVTNGDLTQRVEFSGNDELAKLSEYVDEIVTQFQSVISGMSQNAVQLASSAEESSAVAIQTKQNIVEQQQQTQLVATAVHEFTSTVQEVANSAASAAEASDEADHATNEGMDVLQRTISMISTLNEEISESTTAIHQLSQQSNEIGSVVDVIDGISEQTNLLALNAAIEAARAGEAGRGFAVVADEVRSLASRTQQSTEEIKAMIQSLQTSSNHSMQRMEQGSEQAKVTAEMAQQAGEALSKIANSVEKINSMNVQIATAAEQQSSVTNEINQNVTAINDISNQTATGAEQSSAASVELAKLTESMRENVSRFNY